MMLEMYFCVEKKTKISVSTEPWSYRSFTLGQLHLLLFCSFSIFVFVNCEKSIKNFEFVFCTRKRFQSILYRGGGKVIEIGSRLFKASADRWDTPQVSVYGRLDRVGSIRLP